jgi:membrane peptidoglycan carboxypeptidase
LQEICPVLEIKTTIGEKIRGVCDKSSKEFVKSDARFFVNSTIANRFLRPAGTWRENLTIPNANIAAKTGTSTTRIRGIEYPIDNYVIGYTPEITILSWTGNANGKHLNRGSFGTLSIAPFWNQIVRGVFDKYPELVKDFIPPKKVIKKNGFWTRINQDPAKYKIPAMTFVSKEENRRKTRLLKQKAVLGN